MDELALQILSRQHRYKLGLKDSEIPWLEAAGPVQIACSSYESYPVNGQTITDVSFRKKSPPPRADPA